MATNSSAGIAVQSTNQTMQQRLPCFSEWEEEPGPAR